MWNVIGKALLKLGKWCVGNPEEVIAIVKAAKEIKK